LTLNHQRINSGKNSEISAAEQRVISEKQRSNIRKPRSLDAMRTTSLCTLFVPAFKGALVNDSVDHCPTTIAIKRIRRFVGRLTDG
jgi:hypothetical protein